MQSQTSGWSFPYIYFMINSNKVAALILYLTLSVATKAEDLVWRQSYHDENCYSQGLSFLNETHILESCGLYGQSYFQIYNYDPNTSSITIAYKTKIFPQKYFVEGAVLFPKNQIIYILTWRQKTVFRYKYTKQSNNFQWLSPLKWFSQGWGLTHNNTHLFVSDGSSHLYVVDDNMTVLETLKVVDKRGAQLNYLNELEWRQERGQQFIYANVYYSTNVYRINALTGRVVDYMDLAHLKSRQQEDNNLRADEVLNGIAFSGNTMVVTGKKWKLFFQTQLQLDQL